MEFMRIESEYTYWKWNKALLSETKQSEETAAESVLGWYLSLMGTE